ncbi:unnamed protein product [Brugia timori]|uniref:Secreted protein n=1 Tax=Brugia timori TaxID=42155 RepID=A0A0R3RDN6_9BILA|nr:unnamed protein product [Brugia timori]
MNFFLLYSIVSCGHSRSLIIKPQPTIKSKRNPIQRREERQPNFANSISMNGARTKVPAPEPQTAIPVAMARFFFKRNKELDKYC